MSSVTLLSSRQTVSSISLMIIIFLFSAFLSCPPAVLAAAENRYVASGSSSSHARDSPWLSHAPHDSWISFRDNSPTSSSIYTGQRPMHLEVRGADPYLGLTDGSGFPYLDCRASQHAAGRRAGRDTLAAFHPPESPPPLPPPALPSKPLAAAAAPAAVAATDMLPPPPHDGRSVRSLVNRAISHLQVRASVWQACPEAAGGAAAKTALAG